MKRLVYAILIVLLIATLVGCSGNPVRPPESTITTPPPSETPETDGLSESSTNPSAGSTNSSELTETPGSINMESYIGDGDFAIYVQLRPNHRELNGSMFEADLCYLGFYADGTVIRAIYPLKSTENISNYIFAAPLGWFQKGQGDATVFEGEYCFENGKLVFSVYGDTGVRVDFECILDSKGDLSFSTYNHDSGYRAEGVYQYGGSSKDGRVKWITNFQLEPQS